MTFKDCTTLGLAIVLYGLFAVAAADCRDRDRQPDYTNDCNYLECRNNRWVVEHCGKSFWKQTHFNPITLVCEYHITSWSCRHIDRPTTTVPPTSAPTTPSRETDPPTTANPLTTTTPTTAVPTTVTTIPTVCTEGSRQPDYTSDCNYLECRNNSWVVMHCSKSYFKQTHFNPTNLKCEYHFTAWSCKPIHRPTTTVPPTPVPTTVTKHPTTPSQATKPTTTTARPSTTNPPSTTARPSTTNPPSTNTPDRTTNPPSTNTPDRTTNPPSTNTHDRTTSPPSTNTPDRTTNPPSTNTPDRTTNTSETTGAPLTTVTSLPLCTEGSRQPDYTNDCNYLVCRNNSWVVKHCSKSYLKQTHFNPISFKCEYHFTAWSCKPIDRPKTTVPPTPVPSTVTQSPGNPSRRTQNPITATPTTEVTFPSDCPEGSKQPDYTNDCSYLVCRNNSWVLKHCSKSYLKQTHFNPISLKCEYHFTAWSCKPIDRPTTMAVPTMAPSTVTQSPTTSTRNAVPPLECQEDSKKANPDNDCEYFACVDAVWTRTACGKKLWMKQTHFNPETHQCEFSIFTWTCKPLK